jgi:hypothetical protein
VFCNKKYENNMEYKIENEKVKDFFKVVDDLEKLLTDRIIDLHEVKGGMQARHAYILYRKLLWEAKYLMRDNLKEIKSESK